MQSAKQAAANVAASAKAGMEKTKATMQEKGERMTTRDPVQKEMATERKEERIHGAERQKQETRGQSAAAAGGTFGHDYGTGGEYPMGGDIRQDYPHGMGGEMGGGAAGIGAGGVGGTDPNVAGGARTGYGSGGTI